MAANTQTLADLLTAQKEVMDRQLQTLQRMDNQLQTLQGIKTATDMCLVKQQQMEKALHFLEARSDQAALTLDDTARHYDQYRQLIEAQTDPVERQQRKKLQIRCGSNDMTASMHRSFQRDSSLARQTNELPREK
jgi:hypothetical protein